MKKRIEKIVKWTKSSHERLTHLKKYSVQSESENYYVIINDLGGLSSWFKEDFKIVSEREVLEFEGLNLDKLCQYEYSVEITSKVDLTNYDLKVIATPKDNPLESKSKEELIEIINELKEKE